MNETTPEQQAQTEIEALKAEIERIRAPWGEAATERDLLVNDKAAILGGIYVKEIEALRAELRRQSQELEAMRAVAEQAHSMGLSGVLPSDERLARWSAAFLTQPAPEKP